jgi:hypothetical protein
MNKQLKDKTIEMCLGVKEKQTRTHCSIRDENTQNTECGKQVMWKNLLK